MAEEANNWIHFTAQKSTKRKRAELVCIFCHSKKVKCDLKAKTADGRSKCTNCDAANQDCRIRPSKRGKQRQNHEDDQGTESLANRHQEATSRQMTIIDSITDLPQSAVHQEPGDIAADSGFLDLDFNHEPPPQPAPQSMTFRTQSIVSPSEGPGHSHSGDVDTGYLQVYGPENQEHAEQQNLSADLSSNGAWSDPRRQELQQCFAETYFEYCYTWCPVLDRDTLSEEMARSPLLADAVALAASHIQPPLMPHDGPASYYERARLAFYNDEEADGLITLKALLLFYWWAPRPPSIAHRHSSWWWTSVIIRHAQQMNIHREPSANHPFRDRLSMSVRRRIWWTAFARERLTALCQSKPCIIDPDDCNLGEPQLSDFPNDPVSQRKGLIFIHWTRLCAIMGRIAKTLSRSPNSSFPTNLHQELVDWVQALPPEIRLHIESTRTETFDRDVHQLYLPYLTTIIILHLKRSAHDLPQALPPAFLAASCIARILRDILARGNARFLMAITCWYSGTAFIALLQAARIQQLHAEAQDGITILINTVEQLQKMWGSANIIRQGFERLIKTSSPEASLNNDHQPDVASSGALNHEANLAPAGDFDWTALFPFVSRSTNKIAGCLLTDKAHGTVTRGLPSPNNMLFYETMLNQYNGFLEPFTDYNFDLSNLGFEI